MRISSIYTSPIIPTQKLSFGTVAAAHGKSDVNPDLRMNFTCFDRCCCDKKEKVHYISSLIGKSEKPVEILYCGCSDGTAVFDDLMLFVKEGIPLDKIRINAFDISKEMVDIAKSGRINITDREIDDIKSMYDKHVFWLGRLPLLNIRGNDIPFIEGILNTKYRHSYVFNPELLKHINFYQSDLFTELGKRTDDVYRYISCENLAVYLTEEEQKKAAEMFYNIMKPESMIVVGYSDANYKFVYDEQAMAGLPEHLRSKILSNSFFYAPNAMVKRLNELGINCDKTVSKQGCALVKPV